MNPLTKERTTETVEGIDWNSLSPPCALSATKKKCPNKADVLAEWKGTCPHDGGRWAICRECFDSIKSCGWHDKVLGEYIEIGPL